MPGYNSQRRGTARISQFTTQFFFFVIVMYVPFCVFCVLFVCKCVLYCCYRVLTQLQFYNNNNNINNINPASPLHNTSRIKFWLDWSSLTIPHEQSTSITAHYTHQNCVRLQWRTEGVVLGVQTHPPKFRSFDKAESNSQFHGKYMRNNLIRIWVSLICKLSGTPD
jgi:hypothetical protein